MAELKIKSCGWQYNHAPHHVVQHSQDSFNCPGLYYPSIMDEQLEEARYWAEHGG
ncbi:hypothetical protein SEA_ZEINA_79 [Arthrobacter phage Zeina]|nr:hypothetical protein SEA_ZEINA_79 [Arthrobacter phage Zeina]